jgi:hemerythrin superfamily protein
MRDALDAEMPNKSRPAAANESPALVGVFQLLAEQHHDVGAMLKSVRAEPAQRATLWPTLRQKLLTHEHSEVRELYPVLRQDEQTQALADHHDDEARQLDALIGRLDHMAPDTALWGTLFEQLATTVLGHANEEETSIFPAAQDALGEELSIQLKVTVVDAQQKLMTLV